MENNWRYQKISINYLEMSEIERKQWEISVIEFIPNHPNIPEIFGNYLFTNA